MQELKMKGAFLTGSRAYGMPMKHSDVDIVVLVEDSEAVMELTRFSEDGVSAGGGMSLKFGPLNLIVVSTEEELELWRRGTEELKARRPVTRAEAIEHFKKLRGHRGQLL
jgi:hypothetical protein